MEENEKRETGERERNKGPQPVSNLWLCNYTIAKNRTFTKLCYWKVSKIVSHHRKDSCQFALFLPQTWAFRVSNTDIEIAPCLHSHSFLMWSQCNSDKMIKVSTWRMDKVHLKQTSSLCKVIFTERWNEWSNNVWCSQTAAVYLWRPDNNSTANVTINIMCVKF